MRAADPGDRVGRALTQLPELRAPHTLLPRVMAAVHAWASRPWYQRPWFTWPMGWQLATVGGLLAAVAVAWVWLPLLHLGSVSLPVWLTAPGTTLSPDTTSALAALRVATGILWQALQPVMFYAFLIVAVMTGTCLVAAMALNRAVFGRT